MQRFLFVISLCILIESVLCQNNQKDDLVRGGEYDSNDEEKNEGKYFVMLMKKVKSVSNFKNRSVFCVNVKCI